MISTISLKLYVEGYELNHLSFYMTQFTFNNYKNFIDSYINVESFRKNPDAKRKIELLHFPRKGINI